MSTIREQIEPAAWQASVTSLPYSKSASNEVYKGRDKSRADHVVTAKVGNELLVIYLNNFNKTK